MKVSGQIYAPVALIFWVMTTKLHYGHRTIWRHNPEDNLNHVIGRWSRYSK